MVEIRVYAPSGEISYINSGLPCKCALKPSYYQHQHTIHSLLILTQFVGSIVDAVALSSSGEVRVMW